MNITPDDYQLWSTATAIYPNRGVPAGLPYLALGFCGEAAELMRTVGGPPSNAGAGGLVETEAGDVLWHIAQLHTCAGIYLDAFDGWEIEDDVTIPSEWSPADTLVLEAGRVAKIAKKLLRDGQGVLRGQLEVDLREALRSSFLSWLWWVQECGPRYGVDAEGVAAANLRKLSSRLRRGKLGGSGDRR